MPPRKTAAPRAPRGKAAVPVADAGPAGRMTLQLPMASALDLIARATGFGGDSGWSWLPYVSGQVLGDSERMDDAYKREAWVAACVNLHAVAMSSVKLRVWDREPDDEDAQEVTSGPIFDLFQRVSPGLDQSLLRTVDAMNINLSGESVWFLRDKSGEPVATIGTGPDSLIELPYDFVPVRGDRVNLEIDPATGYPRIWRVSTSENMHRAWPYEAALNNFELPDPARPWRGIGRLALAYGYASQNYLAGRYQTNLLKNDGAPGGIVSMEIWPTPDQRNLLKGEVTEWDNPAFAGKTKLLFGGASYTNNRVVPKDMEYGRLIESNKEDIAAIFATPPALLGDHQENFATFAGHMLIYLSGRLVPYLMALAEGINRRLIGRLRDRSLSKLRVRFDTDALAQRFRDLEALGNQIKGLTDAGIPLNQALMLVGLKTDPIDGGDMPMVMTGLTPLPLAILNAKADTAIRLQQAGVDGQRAFELVDLDAEYFEPPPLNPLPTDANGPPAASDPAAPPAKALPASTPDTPPEPEAPPIETKASAAERIAVWRHLQRLQRDVRSTLNGRLKRVFYDMRRAQLRALEQYAETGSVDRTTVSSDVRGLGPAPGQPLLVYRGRAPTVPVVALRSLDAAWREDAQEEATLLAADDPRLYREVRVDCCGTTERRRAPWRPRQAAWARRYPAFARAGLSRCRDLAILQRIQLTEAEIDQLLVAADERWSKLLADKIRPLVERAHRLAAKDLQHELGVDTVDAIDPAVLQRIAARALQVAEGTTSVVAQRLRSDLLRTLSDSEASGGTLQQVIRDSLNELKATTTRAFNSTSARALTIARTETAVAVNGARSDQLDGAFNQGIIASKEWLTSGRGPASAGGTVRDSHYVMEGQRTVPGMPYRSGAGNELLYPGDPSAPAEDIINCQCGERAIIKGDE